MRKAIFLVLLIPTLAFAGEQTRVYDSHGRSIGTVTPQGQGTVRFHDARGRSQGTATRTGNTTTFYDARGRVVGRATR